MSIEPIELRKTMLVLAQNNYTPLSFWLDETLVHLRDWIDANNELMREREANAKRGHH